MAYSLGIDLGTTCVGAAVARDGHVAMFPLGDRSTVMPAAVYVSDDGRLVGGEPAARRLVSEPDRVAVNIKRGLGNPIPMLIGGTSHTATALLGALLRDVLTRVTEAEGDEPDAIVLTHPANWGKLRRTLFQDVPERVGLSGFRAVTEPEAAAAHYAATHRLDVGELIAVYDFGGGTLDATVLRRMENGIEVLGTPEGVENLGGVDFDDAVFSYVDFATGGALRRLNMSDPRTEVAVARLRQDCILAKEALSSDTETTIPVLTPGGQQEVRLTREQFEGMIRLPVESTLGALSRTLRMADVTSADLSAVLLVGGSSQIPLIAQMVSQKFGRPAVVYDHPKDAVALGAAILASSRAQVDAADAAEIPPPPGSRGPAARAASAMDASAPPGERVAAAASTAMAEPGFPPPASTAPRSANESLGGAAGCTMSAADTLSDHGSTNQQGPPVMHRSDPDSAGQAALSGPGIAPPPSRAAKKAQRSRRSSHAIVAVVVLVLLVLMGGALLLGTGRDPHGVRITGNGSAATPAAASSTVAQTTATNGRSVQ
jgi:actin-like ATPase involved in cell morphogenesis